MSKLKNSMYGLGELAMMGKFVPVKNPGEVDFLFHYIMDVLCPEKESDVIDIYGEYLHKYGTAKKVTHIGCCTVMGMDCITFCVDPQDGETPKPFEYDYETGYPASFCFVYNTRNEDLSEWGDCFFEKKSDGYYHRVS